MLGKYFVCFIILLLTSVRISPVILGSVSCKFSYDIQFHTLLYDWQLHKRPHQITTWVNGLTNPMS